MRRILVGLDGSPLAETILPFVEMLAGKMNAHVRLLHVASVPEHIPTITDHPSIDEIVRRAKGLAEEYLREQRRRLAAAGVESSVAVVTGDPAREIVAYAQREAFDVLALATHGRSGVQRWAYGSVADQVLHTTAVPLLLVRPAGEWAAIPRGLRRIVVPLDGSPEAESALKMAEPLAVRWGVPLVLLRLVEPLLLDFAGDPSGMAYVDYQGIMDNLLESARDYLEGTAATLRERGVGVDIEASIAHPAAGIAAHTRHHPDGLVVLTTHGRSGWRRFVLGSVAGRVVQTVAAPILVCPPSGDRATV
jgi:nucleotide-binding universal stress UspA family protein